VVLSWVFLRKMHRPVFSEGGGGYIVPSSRQVTSGQFCIQCAGMAVWHTGGPSRIFNDGLVLTFL
jgi:hypothetical protein